MQLRDAAPGRLRVEAGGEGVEDQVGDFGRAFFAEFGVDGQGEH